MKCSVLGAKCFVLVLGAAFPAVAEACPICFRDSDSPMTAGVVAGVGTLLSITGGVLGGIVVLIRRIVRAERMTTHPSAERMTTHPSAERMTTHPSAEREGGK